MWLFACPRLVPPPSLFIPFPDFTPEACVIDSFLIYFSFLIPSLPLYRCFSQGSERGQVFPMSSVAAEALRPPCSFFFTHSPRSPSIPCFWLLPYYTYMSVADLAFCSELHMQRLDVSACVSSSRQSQHIKYSKTCAFSLSHIGDFPGQKQHLTGFPAYTCLLFQHYYRSEMQIMVFSSLIL